MCSSVDFISAGFPPPQAPRYFVDPLFTRLVRQTKVLCSPFGARFCDGFCSSSESRIFASCRRFPYSERYLERLHEASLTAPLVIFDLDGTLIDTAPDLIESLNHTIEAVDLAPVTFDDLTHLVGQGVRIMIRRAFELRKSPLDTETENRLFARYMEHYEAH